MDKHEYLQAVEWLNEQTEKYDAGNPQVSDEEWDRTYFDVQKYESENRDEILPNSPTQKIIYNLVTELKKKTHNHPMLSLAKTKEVNEVYKFLNNKDFIVMAKMDGLTCSLHYENGYLVSAETRGNGEVGEDVTHNAFVIPSIPKRINYKEPLTVDGEIICTYDDFHNWSNEYKNPRNFAAGSIRLLDSEECHHRDLTFVAWDAIEDIHSTLSLKLSFLVDLGFIIVPFVTNINVDYNTKIIEEDIEAVKRMSALHSYPIDGVVFKLDNIDEYVERGRTAHHFSGGLAFKFTDELYDTKLKYIDWTMGRTGVLTPVAVFDPIEIDSTIVERASLHNVSVMRKLLGSCAYVGEPLKIFKANQIIPQIAEAGPHYDYGYVVSHGGVSANDCPEHCPVCGSTEISIITSADGVENLICENSACSGKLINRIEHFFGKKGLDAKGISEKTIEKLIDWEWVTEIEDMFNLRQYQKEWINKTGFGTSSVSKILDSIEQCKKCSLEAFITAIGIPLVGSKVSKVIAEKVKTWENFREMIESGYDFSSWAGFGYEMNKSIIDFDYDEADKLSKYVEFKEMEELSAATTSLKDKTFVITGKLKLHKNRQELVDKIENAGGKVQSSVSSKTMYLVNNDVTSTSAKNIKAKELNIPIITEEELLEML